MKAVSRYRIFFQKSKNPSFDRVFDHPHTLMIWFYSTESSWLWNSSKTADLFPHRTDWCLRKVKFCLHDKFIRPFIHPLSTSSNFALLTPICNSYLIRSDKRREGLLATDQPAKDSEANHRLVYTSYQIPLTPSLLRNCIEKDALLSPPNIT